MPDDSGKFKRISINKVWPGHRDYDPDENLKKEEVEWEDLLHVLDGKKTTKK
jgi:hypothetical protein